MYEKLFIKMNFTEKNKKLHKLQFLFIESIKINWIEICQHCDFWMIHFLRRNHLIYKHILQYWKFLNDLTMSSFLHIQQKTLYNLTRSLINLSNIQKSFKNIEISSQNFQIYLLFLWFEELIKLINLIKVFFLCLCMKYMMLNALLIFNMQNTFEIFKLLFESKWSKIFIDECKHEKLLI